jgi:hypothetical protein
MRLSPNQDREVQAAFDGYVKPPEWQPIETAPKDGTEIWLGAHGGNDPRRQRVLVCFRSRNCWRSSHDDERLSWEPTHWQPYFVPDPPTTTTPLGG